jgi:hypothetical protein
LHLVNQCAVGGIEQLLLATALLLVLQSQGHHETGVDQGYLLVSRIGERGGSEGGPIREAYLDLAGGIGGRM